ESVALQRAVDHPHPLPRAQPLVACVSEGPEVTAIELHGIEVGGLAARLDRLDLADRAAAAAGAVARHPDLTQRRGPTSAEQRGRYHSRCRDDNPRPAHDANRGKSYVQRQRLT